MIDGRSDVSWFNSWAQEQLELDGAPSLSVAVGLRDTVVFADAIGLADRAQGRRATPETAYLLASATKPITATAACLLAERGAIDLDEPVERYLDGATLPRHFDGPVPTVRQLLQHRAGLGTHFRFFYGYPEFSAPRFGEVVSRYGHVVSVPGSSFAYSNLGYGIVDEVIRVASGSDPATFTREAVFEPLGMSSARVGPSYDGDAPVAIRYAKDGVAYPDYDVDHRGASLGWSSGPDLVRFGLAHAEGGVLTDAVVRGMQEALPCGDLPSAYGLGWSSREVDGTSVISHAGGMGGVSTLLLVVPQHRVAVAALTNGTGSALPPIAVDHLMRRFAPAVEMPGLLGSADDEPPPGRVPDAALGTWEGAVDTYVGQIPIRLALVAGGAGTGWLGDEGPAACTPLHPGRHDLVLALPLQLPTPDAMVSSPTITCHLDGDTDTLSGTVTTEPDDECEPVGNCMTHWCRLSRT